ncbi:MAG: NAD(P)/FAD-dependent oxidoreductase [Candidatus Kapabacteria bacterium]|nr:NAD(P)/FAD-dependent oxidoreductase [Candidatus Kapabacteria bacterium]
MADFDIIIAGAGVVGLALAKELSAAGKFVLVVEKHPSFGNEISSRNSEVVHSGIYYEKDSLKAKLCVEGRKLLYKWCLESGVPFNKTGKYIIAVNRDEESRLYMLLKKGLDNGVEGLKIVNSNVVMDANTGINCVSALYSPESGIVDSHLLMESFLTKSKEFDCQYVFNHEVTKVSRSNGSYITTLKDTTGVTYEVSSDYFINSAGLGADLIAESAGIDIDRYGYRITYCKGHYFKLRTGLNGIAKNLIYPVPLVNFTGLGVHITLDLSGGLKLGPDVLYLDDREQNYYVPDLLQQKFYESAKRYIPNLSYDDLSPDQSGIRPKLQRKGEPVRDFIINEESSKGLPRFINLIGIESPGLTSCLAIANYVKRSLL